MKGVNNSEGVEAGEEEEAATVGGEAEDVVRIKRGEVVAGALVIKKGLEEGEVKRGEVVEGEVKR